MTSSRPYLIRAMYQWIVDNGMTPHILVDANAEQCDVPQHLISEGKIVLNIAPMAVNGLTLADNEITFSARFDGKPNNIHLPITAILAIYARENGQGMMFSEEESGMMEKDDDTDPTPDPDPETPKPKLRIIK